MASDTTSNEYGSAFSDKEPIGGRGSREDLEAQIAKLREDVSGIAESLKSMATGTAGNAREQAFALRDDVYQKGEHYLRQAQDAASDLEEQLSEKVRAEPVKAVLIAAGIGYLYAKIFR
ncbi:DUF883 family protein [Aurantimonas sp. Leaf443]|uniref:DUF883 family protein n=1 Tax=Aurantimonas sp. Leaf443 TaxID=1736378 RepID=UPI0006FC3238|nr:DUF883 family protein [Aurantimonas sp. Leaf443]KQT82474.1 hypothetical protein ASG48_15480 [Aurantimonas sp. Leaf443]